MKMSSLSKLQAGIGCVGCLGYLALSTLIGSGLVLGVMALYKYVNTGV